MAAESEQLQKSGICAELFCFCCPKIPQKTKINVAQAIVVRIILICHVILSTWRVTIEWNDLRFWLFTLGAVGILFEGSYTVIKKSGLEHKWFCPLYAVYLVTMLPLIWLLEVYKTRTFIESGNQESDTTVFITTKMTTIAVDLATLNITSNVTESTSSEAKVEGILNLLQTLDSNTWIVIIEELLVYLIVLGRWLLPRNNFSKEALSDLLIDYLGMASDIMEFLALFDEDQVRGSWTASYVVLSVWTVSFFQFVPVLADRESKEMAKKSSQGHCFQESCGESFIDILSTCLALFLQDGPFLVVRLYIILRFDLITYSLIFFVLKNAIVVLLLTYKLGNLLIKLPCCFNKEFTVEGVDNADMENPLAYKNNVFVSSIYDDPLFTSSDKETPIFQTILENEKLYNQSMRNRADGHGFPLDQNGNANRPFIRRTSESTWKSSWGKRSSLSRWDDSRQRKRPLSYSKSLQKEMERPEYLDLSLREQKANKSLRNKSNRQIKTKSLPLSVKTADGLVLNFKF